MLQKVSQLFEKHITKIGKKMMKLLEKFLIFYIKCKEHYIGIRES